MYQFAQYFRDRPMYMMRDGRGEWLGLAWLLVFAILAGIGMWLLYRLLSQHGRREKADPLEIARERYARGEITKDELADIKKELKA
jgi:putative membrane protein